MRRKIFLIKSSKSVSELGKKARALMTNLFYGYLLMIAISLVTIEEQ